MAPNGRVRWPSFGVAPEELPSSGGEDGFVMRLGPNGHVVELKRVGGAGQDRGIAAAYSSTSNSGATVYVVGSFTGTAHFGSTSLVASSTAGLCVDAGQRAPALLA